MAASGGPVGLPEVNPDEYLFFSEEIAFPLALADLCPKFPLRVAHSEWGAGARVKDAAILAHQIAKRWALSWIYACRYSMEMPLYLIPCCTLHCHSSVHVCTGNAFVLFAAFQHASYPARPCPRGNTW